MNNWAIVIGINEYWSADANLSLAVNDALDVTEWLIDKNGGNVPPSQLYLLTHPAAPPTFTDGTPIPSEIQRRDATFDTLVGAVQHLLGKSGEEGERFYFYFSGHGLTNRENFVNEPGLALADFEKRRFDNALMLSSLTGFFETLRFNEQFFIIDACRNVPWESDRYRLGRLPDSGIASADFTPSQFLFFATASLLRAVQAVEPGDKNSFFTKVLLDGLRGKGTAKIYRPAEEMYHVSTDRLLQYIKSRVKEKKIVVSDSNPALYQRPRFSLDYDGDFPVLAKFGKDAFDEEKLRIHIEPPDVRKKAQIFVSSSDAASYYQIISSIENSPLELPPKTPRRRQKLLPMTYNVQAFAKGFKPEIKPSRHFDLYEPKTVVVEFIADDGGAQPSRMPPWLKTRSGELPSPADLTIKSADPLAPLEIRNIDYEMVAFGQGQLTAPEQKAGLYRARLILPEGDISEEIIELRGKDEEITLAAPPLPAPAIFNESINDFAFNGLRGNNSFVFPHSDSIANIPAAILALLGRAASSKSASAGGNAQDNFRVIMVEEEKHYDEAGEYLSLTQLRLRRQNGGETDEIFLKAGTFPAPPHIALFTAAAAPENYFLSIKLPDRNAANFSVSVLPGRATLLILHRHANGSVNVFGFSLAAAIDESDAGFYRENVNQLRRMELLQRFHINRRVDMTHALQYADALAAAAAGRLDPFGGCLAGYTKLLLNKSEELGDLTARLVELYDALGDSHVLRAEFLAARSATPVGAITSEYYKALERGIPVFAEGVTRLVRAVEKYNLKHPRVSRLYEVFGNHPQSILWTSWTPFPAAEAVSPPADR